MDKAVASPFAFRCEFCAFDSPFRFFSRADLRNFYTVSACIEYFANEGRIIRIDAEKSGSPCQFCRPCQISCIFNGDFTVFSIENDEIISCQPGNLGNSRIIQFNECPQ